jgi:hypothetical protein
MTDKSVILFSGSELNRGIVDKLKFQGITIIVADRNPQVYIPHDIHLQCDVTDVDFIFKTLQDKGVRSIIGSYTSSDIAIASVNQINNRFGLKSVDQELLENLTSKRWMTGKWKAKGLLNRFSTPSSEITFDDIIRKNIPLIIKPNNASSSRGITILPDSFDESLYNSAIEKASNFSEDKVALIEEFVVGIEHTIELLGDDSGNVSVYAISKKYHTQNTINNKISNKLHYNSLTYSNEYYQEIANFGVACYKALGLKNSLGHLEVLIKPNGDFTPVEMNARSSGFIASHLVDFASGKDYLSDYFTVLQGFEIVPAFHQSTLSGMYFFYDIPSGSKSRKEVTLMEYLPPQIKSVYSNREKLTKGRTFDLLACDNDRYGYEILYGDRSILTIDEILKAENLFLKNFLE